MIITRITDGVAAGVVAFILIPTAPCVAVGMFAVILMPTAPAAGMPPPDSYQPHPEKTFLISFGTLDAKQRRHSDLVKRGFRRHH